MDTPQCISTISSNFIFNRHFLSLVNAFEMLSSTVMKEIRRGLMSSWGLGRKSDRLRPVAGC